MLSDVIFEDGKFRPMSVLNISDQLCLVDETPLDPHVLAINAQEAASAFIAAGTAANTVRSYRSALAYWSPGCNRVIARRSAMLRYRQRCHSVRPRSFGPTDGTWARLLPPSIDAALVVARVKAKVRPPAFDTVSHRLSVLGKWHRLHGGDVSVEQPTPRTIRFSLFFPRA